MNDDLSHRQTRSDGAEPGRSDQELALHGGVANRGKVVRVEHTVHRPTSAATHALLRHLENDGFDGAPGSSASTTTRNPVLHRGGRSNRAAPRVGAHRPGARQRRRTPAQLPHRSRRVHPAALQLAQVATSSVSGRTRQTQRPNVDNIAREIGKHRASGLDPVPSRQQQVLDLGHPEAYAYLLGRLDALLQEYPIAHGDAVADLPTSSSERFCGGRRTG
jgi:hypothetical protein